MKIRTDFVTNSSSASFVSYSLYSMKLYDFILEAAKKQYDGKIPVYEYFSWYDLYVPISEQWGISGGKHEGACGFMLEDGDHILIRMLYWEDEGNFYKNILKAVQFDKVDKAKLRVLLDEEKDNGNVVEEDEFIADRD